VITEYTNNNRYGYALADCTEAYNHNNAGKPGAVVEHARRHTFFVYPYQGAPAYAVVMDDIRKDEQSHEFTWQMMFSDQMALTMGDGRAVFEPVKKPESRLVVRIHSCSQAVLTTDNFRPIDYHPPAKFPRFKATTHDVNPRFIAILLPLTAAMAEPEVRFESQEGKRITTVKWSQHTDTLVWSDNDGSISLD